MYEDQKCKRASLKVQNSRFNSHGKFDHELDEHVEKSETENLYREIWQPILSQGWQKLTEAARTL